MTTLDLPQVYAPQYTQARKQSNGMYKLYWRGTDNEIFYGKLFHTAQFAKNYLAYMIMENNKIK